MPLATPMEAVVRSDFWEAVEAIEAVRSFLASPQRQCDKRGKAWKARQMDRRVLLSTPFVPLVTSSHHFVSFLYPSDNLPDNLCRAVSVSSVPSDIRQQPRRLCSAYRRGVTERRWRDDGGEAERQTCPGAATLEKPKANIFSPRPHSQTRESSRELTIQRHRPARSHGRIVTPD